MNLEFQPMTREFASQIIAWSYDPPYDIYDYDEVESAEAVDYLIEERNQVFAVLLDGELIGFRSFGADARVEGGNYDNSHVDTGGGIRPELTGKGLGSKVILAGLRFGQKKFNTDRFRVSIASFNTRAIKACQKVGFQISGDFLRSGDHKPFKILTINLSNTT